MGLSSGLIFLPASPFLADTFFPLSTARVYLSEKVNHQGFDFVLLSFMGNNDLSPKACDILHI